MRKESFDRKNEKYGADRRFRTHPADRTKRRNVDGRYADTLAHLADESGKKFCLAGISAGKNRLWKISPYLCACV